MGDWHSYFSLESSCLMVKHEAQSILRYIKKNKEPRLGIDGRFYEAYDIKDYLKSAVEKIDAEICRAKNRDSTVCLRLSVIERFVLYQTLRDTNKLWALFFLKPALFDISKCSSRGYTAIFRETKKKDLLQCKPFLAMHIESVLREFKKATGEDLL